MKFNLKFFAILYLTIFSFGVKSQTLYSDYKIKSNIFSDIFSDNSNDWITGSDKYCSYKIYNNEYSISTKCIMNACSKRVEKQLPSIDLSKDLH